MIINYYNLVKRSINYNKLKTTNPNVEILLTEVENKA
jgi:hypothetical protein